MADQQLRYKAFLSSHPTTNGSPPPNYAFIRWIYQQWASFDAANPNLPHSQRSRAFDHWLTAKYLSGQPIPKG
jgi:hypothetical protein